jgi:hypothetical protein
MMLQRGGMNVGPTDRIGLSGAAPVESAAGDGVSGAGGVPAPVVAAPFFAVAAGLFAASGRAIFLALS